jgi:hypothetical protein
VTKCPYCQRPADAHGAINHDGDCFGLKDAGLIVLQRYALDQRIRELESLIDRFMLVPIQDDAHDKTWDAAFAAGIPRAPQSMTDSAKDA